MALLWGIDLGGTKIEGVVLDSEAWDKPLCRLRIPTQAHRGYIHVLDRIAELCELMEKKTGVAVPPRIGMGTPGVIDPKTGLLKNCNTQCLNGNSFHEDLARYHFVDFVVANDANCFALAEATLGAARGYPTVFGVILGTGVGGGIVVNGRVLGGCHGIAGEWGQIVLEPKGPLSNYGTRGTVESLISGPALERAYEKLTGKHRRLKDIADLAEAGTDPNACATLDHLTSYLAKALGIIIDVLDPHAIVLGGGVGNIKALYTKEMREKITAVIFNSEFEAALLKPTLGDSAGVFGAAMLVAN
jgi:predicted NBD/HSP70 family sugar kinase